MPQTAFLFDDTVRDNVTLGADVPDADVWAALRSAQADGFVAALPEGLDTQLGERGTSLSGGQRQRISLARALVRRPRLLILDDATSAVDPEVEARILAALRESRTGCTLVVVAYRKATIGLADEVRPPRRTAGSSTAAPTQSCSPGARPTPTWSTPTSSEHPSATEEADDHVEHDLDDRQRTPRRSETIRRGVHSHPSSRTASAGTLVLAVVASLGQVVVPIAVQQTLDRGIRAQGGARRLVHRAGSGCSPRWRSWSPAGRRTS